jgi:hypothetical protein
VAAATAPTVLINALRDDPEVGMAVLPRILAQSYPMYRGAANARLGRLVEADDRGSRQYRMMAPPCGLSTRVIPDEPIARSG